MTHSTCLETKLDLAGQLFAAATHEASAAMCRWTKSLVRLTLDEVCQLPLSEVCAALEIGERRLTMVVLEIPGEIGGTIMLLFDEETGRRLAASLTGKPHDPRRGWSELDISALNETVNIVGCAYINAITRLIEYELMPAAPCFIQDYGASVLQQALAVQVAESDTALVCRTGFHHAGEKLSWLLLFVPTPALRSAMEASLE